MFVLASNEVITNIMRLVLMMKIKNISFLLFLLCSFQSFSQKSDYKWVNKPEIDRVYLDSIKNTFVKHDMAVRVDSLWLNELTSLDIYNEISDDISNVNSDTNVDFELPTELLKSRLAAMDAKSPFNIEYNPGLENIIKSFLKNRKKSFGKLMAISEYYFPLFEEALDKQNVPLEIKYLAIVESSLNPKAVSRVGATGLWQFMYETGKQYNLHIDSYVDERSDPLKSSAAAAQYMANMHLLFGDWDLVLASYNSGPGNVAKAIRRSGGQQNFWNIKSKLPKETQGYLPAFLATMYIYEYHNEHGIVADRALIKHFQTDTIMVKKQMSFKQISDLIDIPEAQLKLLNPSYKLAVVPHYKDRSFSLRLPKDKISLFTSNEEQIYAYIEHDSTLREKSFQKSVAVNKTDSSAYTIQSTTKTYRVVRGDNLSNIANRFNVSIDDLKKWNSLKTNALSCGVDLTIVTTERVVIQETDVDKSNLTFNELKDNSPEVTKGTSTAKSELYYVVRKGDNLGSIAKAHDVSVEDLKKWNHLSDSSIEIGLSLQVGKSKELVKADNSVAMVETENGLYTVKQGDNLGNISKKFGVAIDDLKLWNKLTDNNIGIGRSLVVSKSKISTEVAVASKSKTSSNKEEVSSNPVIIDYLVKKGDSLYSISKKYPGVSISDIIKWNDIRAEDLKPGMKLKISG